MTDLTLRPIFTASPATGTIPTAAQKASPNLPSISPPIASRTSPTANRPVRISPMTYSSVARTGSSSSGQNSVVAPPS
jgi:hypothetical protein